MRPDHDHRPARWVKRNTLRRLARTRTIASVLDDDPAVVAVLAADGWPVELATWLPHSSTLQSAQEQQGGRDVGSGGVTVTGIGGVSELASEP